MNSTFCWPEIRSEGDFSHLLKELIGRSTIEYDTAAEQIDEGDELVRELKGIKTDEVGFYTE